MRILTIAGLLVAGPLLAGTPAQAETVLDQAQRFLGNGNGNDRSAYEQGRQDELRRQQMDRQDRRDARAAQQQRDAWAADRDRRDQRSPTGYGYPTNGYHGY